jgi:hypothetical protein
MTLCAQPPSGDPWLVTRFPVLVVAVVALVLAGGCGSSGSGAAAPDSSGVVRTTIHFELTEWKVTPRDATFRAGHQAMTAANVGKQVHSILILTGTDVAGLPARADGGIDEDALGARLVGRIVDIAPGATGSTEIDLPAGTYTAMCNMAGMAAQADQPNQMHTAFRTVT